MACGAACLASSSSSLPEIGGDAVEYVPALDAGAWADMIEALWDDPDRRATMGRLARARADQFSWQRTARETLAVYRRVVARAPRPSPVPVAVNVNPSLPVSSDRLVTCIRCGQHLVSAPTEGTIIVGASQKCQIAPRAWMCPDCGHVELLAMLAEAPLPPDRADSTLVTLQQPDVSSELSDVAASVAPQEPVSLSDEAPDLLVDQAHGDETIPVAAPERETAHPGDQSLGMGAQRQEGVEGS